MKPRSIHFSAVFALGWVALSAIGLGACATPAPRGLEVELLQDAQVSGLEGAAKGLKKGQKLRAGSQPYLVESPGYLSVLVLPGGPQLPSHMKLSLKKDDRMDSVQCDQVQDSRVQEVLPEVERIQSLIAQGRAKDSLARLDELQRKYPRVTFLNFIRASLLVVLGDQGQALSILGVALRDFPQNESGREMYRTISQGKEPPLPTQAPSQSPATVSPKRVPASLPSANLGRKK